MPRAPGTSSRAQAGTASNTFPHRAHFRRSVEQNMGTSFSANLTPDPETGIGKWTAKTFIDTVRNGRYDAVGRPLLPPMPFPYIAAATDDDLKAIFAYLQSIPPVKNRVPQPVDPTESH